METEAKVVAKLEPEKVDYLEQEGWRSSLDGTQFTKMWDDGSQSEIEFEHVRDWSLRVLKEVLVSFPLHKYQGLKSPALGGSGIASSCPPPPRPPPAWPPLPRPPTASLRRRSVLSLAGSAVFIVTLVGLLGNLAVLHGGLHNKCLQAAVERETVATRTSSFLR
jgi:hypothetical protein